MRAQSDLAATAAVILWTLAAGLALPAAGAVDDWPQWSGPHGNLTSVGNDAFPEPGFALEIAWSQALGSGYSGIAVAGGRLVTALSDGESDVLVALDADTRQLADMLERRGYRIDTLEVGDGYGWASWRTRTDRILETLFPLQ